MDEKPLTSWRDAKVIWSKVSYIVSNRKTRTEKEYSTLSEAINALNTPSK